MAMTSAEELADELHRLPPEKLPLVRRFLDWLVARDAPDAELAEWGMEDYLSTLQEYEDRLARGEIQWH